VRRRIAFVAIVGTLLGSGVVQAAFTPARATACADVIRIRTMTIHIKPVTHDYRVGDIAEVPVTVTRPGDTDPLQQGVPMPQTITEPAAGVIIGIGLHIGPVFTPGYAKTSSTGGAVVKIKIPSYAHPATVNVDAYAYNILVQAPCYTVQEDGFTHKAGVFKVVK